MDKSIAALAGLLVNFTQTTAQNFVESHLPTVFRSDVQAALDDDRIKRAQQLAQSEGTPRHSNGLRPPSALLMGQDITGFYLPAKPLKLSEDVIFPVEGVPSGYDSLWGEFIDAVDELNDQTDLLTYIESLQDVMKRYLWCVPGDQPDVSLYDQCRITAGIATCLAEVEASDDIGYLVAGDISGIQKFIFQVISKGATKQLRARSLYLQLLTEGAARYILRQLDLPITSLIYAGGGHFYLLAPPSYTQQETAIRQHLDDMLLNHHDGDLYLSIGAEKITAADLEDNERYKQSWGNLRSALNVAKSRRFADSRSGDTLFEVFQPRNEYDDKRAEFRKRVTEREQQADVDENEDGLSDLHESFRTFSENARDMQWLVLAEIEPQNTNAGGMQDALAMLGLRVAIVNSKNKVTGNLNNATRVVALRVQDTPTSDNAPDLGLGCPVAVGTRYMVNATARKVVHGREEFATFSELQRSSTGIKRLGVLRMDVDDLGSIFGGGIQSPSLARSAGLSFNMSLFFEGWVAELCRRINDSWRDSTSDDEEQPIDVQPLYAVYSGGDDLFIVGVWDVLPELAQAIHDDFARYACHNPKMHISAGITLHGGKYPLYQAADDAEDALDNAKELSSGTLEPGDGKNAITFLDDTVEWTRWQDVYALSERIENVITSKTGRRSLVQILLQLHERYTDLVREVKKRGKYGKDNKLVWGPWMWHSAYQLARFVERHRDTQSDIDWIREHLADDVPSDSKVPFRGIEIVGLAARWAEARTRK